MYILRHHNCKHYPPDLGTSFVDTSRDKKLDWKFEQYWGEVIHGVVDFRFTCSDTLVMGG